MMSSVIRKFVCSGEKLFCFPGIVSTSDDTRIINNMLALVVWTGAYQERFEPFNFRWEAGIEAYGANNLTMQGNLVAGAERFGYHVTPLDCDDTSGRYSNNMAYSSLIGVGLFAEDEVGGDCALYSGYITWKNHDWGLYYQNNPSLIVDNNVLVENRQGLWTGIIGPSPLEHAVGDKTVEIRNNLVVGTTSSFDCSKDVSPKNDNLQLSALARPKMAPTDGMIGIVFPTFMMKSNAAPTKPFPNIMSYNAIAGLMKLKSKYLMFGGCTNSFMNLTLISSSEVKNICISWVIFLHFFLVLQCKFTQLKAKSVSQIFS